MLSLLKFHASWCGPCKAMTPIIEQLDEEDDELITTNVDVDDNPQVRAEYGVRSIPTLILLSDGKEIARRTGQATLSELKDWVHDQRGGI